MNGQTPRVAADEGTDLGADRGPEVIDEGLVQRLVDSQFPEWAELPVEAVVPGGWDHRTFRLGSDLLVRLPARHWHAPQVAKEQRWLPWLAPQLPLPIPSPVARGVPGEGYPHAWSVYRWLEGETAESAPIDDLDAFAGALAQFLRALQRLDPTDGPMPGPYNFFRGGPVTTYADQTVQALELLEAEIDAAAAGLVWEDAVAATCSAAPVWIHGDVAAGKLLARDGRLAAVLDFGGCGVGDPACDMVIAWTLFDGSSRDVFRRTLSVDAGTWSRGRGWALWTALITLVDQIGSDADGERVSRQVIDQVLADHAAARAGRQSIR